MELISTVCECNIQSQFWNAPSLLLWCKYIAAPRSIGDRRWTRLRRRFRIVQRSTSPDRPTASPAPESERTADAQCAICWDPPHEPTYTACAHCFCRACLSEALSASNRCPVCRQPQPGGNGLTDFALPDAKLSSDVLELAADDWLRSAMTATRQHSTEQGML